MFPDPRLLNPEELRELFVIISKEFVNRLSESGDISELEDLQKYLRAITSEIELKEKARSKVF